MIFKVLPVFISVVLGQQASAGNLTVGLPEVNYEYWNAPEVNTSNNCYNYATNRAEGSWAQPGQASGSQYTTLSCDDVYDAASRDWGLTPTQYFSIDENNEDTLIALVVNPGLDFHWYRRGSNNRWSHKLTFQVFETDSSDKIIVDPVTADRGRYKDFCGYFKVKNYLADPQQQNAGYVRIGGMTDWPQYLSLNKAETFSVLEEIEKSKVILHLFSGRPNPSFSLQSLLNDPAAAGILSKMSKLVKTALVTSDDFAVNSQKDLKIFGPILGATSIFIIDSEGTLFPRGSVIELREKFIRITRKNRKPVILKSSFAEGLRRHLIKL